jgi:hypothetical protein
MTPSGIDPATFRFVAQCLNHCATACPQRKVYYVIKYFTVDRVRERRAFCFVFGLFKDVVTDPSGHAV